MTSFAFYSEKWFSFSGEGAFRARQLCGSGDLAYKLDAEHFAAAPNYFASLAHKCMRYGRKSKPVSDLDTDLSDELRTVQGHIQT